MGFGERLRAKRDAKADARREEHRRAAAPGALVEVRRVHDALEASRLPFAETRVDGVMLKAGEVAHVVVSGAALVEPKRLPGQWQGGSRGVSIRIAKGVSYRTGSSRGTYQQGAEILTPVDEGRFVVTNRRCVFIGSRRTTEWSYSKLVGFSLEGEGVAFFNVSNRQKTTGVLYGTEYENKLDTTIAAAIARAQSEQNHQRLVRELEDEYRYVYEVWQALQAGQEPPRRALPAPFVTELAAPVDLSPGRGSPPTREELIDVLEAAGFWSAEDSEGFGIRAEDDRLKVFWLKSDGASRDQQVPKMAKALRGAGRSARVAREDGYPYVSVTG